MIPSRTVRALKEKERPKYNLWQNSWYMIARAWRERRGVLWLCLALSGATLAASLAELFVTPTVLGMIEARAPLSRLLWAILGFAAILMACGSIRAYLDTIAQFGRVGVRVGLAQALLMKFMTTSYPNTEDQEVQKQCDRAMNAVQGNSQATEQVWTTLTELLTNIVGFGVYLALLSTLDPVLLLVTLVATTAGYFLSKRINEWGYRHRDEIAEDSRRTEYINHKSQDYSLAKDIRMFGMRGWMLEVYDKFLRMMRDYTARRERVYFRADALDVLISLLRNGIAYWYLIVLAIREGLSTSQFLLYFTAVGGFAAWVTGILGGFRTLHIHSLDISCVREFLELAEPFRFEGGEAIEPDTGKEYEIELRNVSYRYPGSEADALRHIDLTIRPGERLAVVGLNGAGKTTLVKLICGFYDPTEGAVLLNGQDIRKYNRRDYYRHFSAVFQQFSIIEMTIAANLSEEGSADMERLSQSLTRAGIAEKIDALPEGVQTHLGRMVYEDGVELSGGETQRLMLARALCKDAPILVLDEPTAALDPIAESEMYQRYGELTAGRTSVYISHRLASTRFCDRILLIEGGGIAEVGTHEELMRSGGVYARLFEIQSRYYREGGAEDEEAV